MSYDAFDMCASKFLLITFGSWLG